MNQQPLDPSYINSLKNMMSSNNAVDFLARQAMQSPQFKSIVNTIKDGGSAKAIAEQMARERGINLDDLINQLTH